MNEAFDALAGRRVVLIGGKGGVGKTTVAIAAALRLRAAVLFTTDPASNLGDILGSELRFESLDAPALYRRFLDRNLEHFLEIADRGTYLDKDELRRFFELSLPGADELMAWMRIGELAEENPSSTVVVDTAPTGHTLRMLGAAEHFRQFAAALDAMQEKHRDLVRQFTRRSVRDAADAFIEEFEATARRRRELLVSSGVFIPVFLSEPWVVEQTKRLIDAVDVPVPFAVLNRVAAPDCARDRARMARDADARAALAPLRVVDAPRACLPLDSAERIAQWAACHAERSEGPGRVDGAPPAPPGPSLTLGVTRILLFAGKGGVGKTTCSASAALQLAQRGPVTLLSVDPAHSVRDVFANQPPPKNLTVETIDTRAKWRRFRDTLGEEIDRAVGALTPSGVSVAHDSEAMRKLVEVAPPGADELFAITRLADLIAEEKTIVVDTAPTGHFLRLIDLPQTAGEWVHEFMRILLRYRELIPAGTLGEELLRASRALHAVDEALRSELCRIVVVTRPERIVVAETERLLGELERRGMPARAVVVNYLTPDTDCPCDRSMRGYELEAVAPLGEVTTIERRDEPPVTLDELAMLLPMSPRA